MEFNHLDWGKCDFFTPKPCVFRKVYQGSENCTISMGIIFPGHTPGPHSHPYEQTCVIVKGKCDFHVGDEVLHCEADVNDEASMVFLSIPANVEHWIENKYDEPVYDFDIFIPKRTADRQESVEVR